MILRIRISECLILVRVNETGDLELLDEVYFIALEVPELGLPRQ